jgi:hypothetical protein
MIKNLEQTFSLIKLCQELRKAVLRKQYPNLSEKELERIFWQEIRQQKEKTWERLLNSSEY